MLKRITNIKDFGVFTNFAGGALPEFAPFNLIYGWNYSGKTTLSRIFRCLEARSPHADYTNGKFSISHADGLARDHDFANPTLVRVFNEDFRKEHLLWDNTDGFNPILLLGAENIEKRKALETKNQEFVLASNAQRLEETELQRLSDLISEAETHCASLIVKELPVGRFDRRHVKLVTGVWNGVLPDALSVDEFRSEREKVFAEQKDELPRFSADVGNSDEVWAEAVSLLSEQIGSVATIPRLAENATVGAWVERGLHLHRDTANCEFCESVIPAERIAALNAHFSTAFKELKARIAKAIETLLRGKISVDGSAYGRSQFYADLHGEHAEAGAAFAHARDALNAALQDLVERLERKATSPFDVIPPPEGSPSTSEVVAAISRFQGLIDENNSRTRQFRTSRETAIERLKKNYVVEAMRAIDLAKLEDGIKVARSAAATSLEKVKSLRGEILAIEAELSEATRGAEAINDSLRRFFGKEDIQVRVTGGDRFTLVRGDRVAKNLSEGERTAIAFCYFITKLLENDNDLANTIVYIDDPISSLDSHHLLHINAFIKTTFLRYDENGMPKYSCAAKQVFISTHNYEFFHLTWDWMANRKPKALSSAYMVERSDSNGVANSRIVECPKSILQFRSEYLFLYHQLAAYAQAPSNDAMVIFNLGNMARRFVEGYLAFKFFEFSAIDQKLPLVITDAIECERARKFMHFYSHTLNRGGGMKLPDMAEAQAAVSSILLGVKTHDPIHYAALEAAA